jgi:hypothetical protein
MKYNRYEKVNELGQHSDEHQYNNGTPRMGKDFDQSHHSIFD